MIDGPAAGRRLDGLRLLRAQNPPHQLEKSGPRVAGDWSHPPRRLLDSPQGPGGVSFKRRPRALHLLDDLLERAPERRR